MNDLETAEYKRIAAELAAARAEAESEWSVEGYEEKQIRRYAEAQRAAYEGRIKPPEIPKYIEVPVPKDWTQVGSMVIGMEGGIQVDSAAQMEKKLNPAWVAEQERKKGASVPQLERLAESPANGAPSHRALDGEDVVFEELRPVLRRAGFRIEHFIQSTPDTVTVTVSRREE